MTSELVVGDNLDPAIGLPSLADASVDHVITDPPYDEHVHMRGTGAACAPVRRSDASKAVIRPFDFAPLSRDAMPVYAAHFARLARRWVLVFCSDRDIDWWCSALEEAGLGIARVAVWVKPDGMPQFSGDRPSHAWEPIVIAHQRRRRRWNGGGKAGVYTVPCRDTSARVHPTQKPLLLMDALVRDFSDPGEIILDPFAGGGSTLVAAKRLGRRYIGYERDPRYAAAASARIQEAQEQIEIPAPRPPRKQGRLVFGGDR